MCYPKPGPRCSPHAKAALDAALAGGDQTEIDKARRAYNATPDGIEALRLAGRHMEADVAEQLHERQLALYTQTKAEAQKAQKETVWAKLNLLAQHAQPKVRLAVASNPNSTSGLLAGLCTDQDKKVALAAQEAYQERAEAERLTQEGQALRHALLRDRQHVSQLSKESIAHHVASLDDMEQVEYARDWQAQPSVLAELATVGDFPTRSAVAGNILTPPSTLSTLVRDENPLVRATAAGNPALRYNDFAVAAQDEDNLVREAVAGNSNTPEEVLQQLLDENQHDPVLAREMLRNENLSEELHDQAASVVARHRLAEVWNYELVT